MSVKSSTELMLYVVLTMPTLNKAYLLCLINILQGIPTDHEGGSYIHVPYITERRPYMSTRPFFLRVTPVMHLPKCVILPEIFQSLDGSDYREDPVEIPTPVPAS
jgi:hypothetical protein